MSGRLKERKQVLEERLESMRSRLTRESQADETSRLQAQIQEMEQRLDDVREKMENEQLAAEPKTAEDNEDEDEDDDEDDDEEDESSEEEEADTSVGHNSSGVQGALEWAHASVRGQRETNEDSHVVAPLKKHNASLIGVFDGHGGHLCSRFCAKRLAPLLNKKKDLSDASIKAAFIELDAEYLEECEDDGSCACTIITRQDSPEFAVANLGDSRALLLPQQGEFRELTSDHKPDRPGERKRIEAAGASVAVDQLVRHGKRVAVARIDGQLAASRAIGDDSLKESDVDPEEQAVSPVPEVTRASWAPGEVLLLACDGLWDVCSSAEAASRTRALLADGATLAQVAQALCSAALELKSDDNVTVIVATRTQGGAAPVTAAVGGAAAEEEEEEEIDESKLSELGQLLRNFEEKEEDEEVDKLTALLKHVNVDSPALSRNAETSEDAQPQAPQGHTATVEPVEVVAVVEPVEVVAAVEPVEIAAVEPVEVTAVEPVEVGAVVEPVESDVAEAPVVETPQETQTETERQPEADTSRTAQEEQHEPLNESAAQAAKASATAAPVAEGKEANRPVVPPPMQSTASGGISLGPLVGVIVALVGIAAYAVIKM